METSDPENREEISLELRCLEEERSSLRDLLRKAQNENIDLNRKVQELDAEIKRLSVLPIHVEARDEFNLPVFELDHISVPMLVVDSLARIVRANPPALKLFDQTRETIELLAIRKLVKETESKQIFAAIHKLHQNDSREINLFLTTEGERRVFTRIVPIQNRVDFPLGQPTYFLIIVDPVTYSTDNAHLLRLEHLAFNQVLEGIMITDINRKIIKVNQGFTDITGYGAEEVVGKTPGFLSSGRHDQSFYDEMWQSLTKLGLWSGEIWNRNKGGTVYPQWLQITRILDPNTQAVFFIAVFSDISQRKKRQQELDRLAFFDTLTGLPNRQAFSTHLESILARRTNDASQFCLLFIDLDKFKQVNDAHGHPEGDAVLRLAAQRIIASIRESDYAARLGGDEFTVVLNRVQTVKDVVPVIENLITQLQKPYMVDNRHHNLSASIGATLIPETEATADNMLRRADLAMYAAKSNGRNQFHFYDHEIDEETHRTLAAHRLVQEAIIAPQERLEIHYQPIRSASSSANQHFECLVRIRDGDSLIYPDKFIDQAESTGSIRELGIEIFTQICRQVSSKAKASSTTTFAINLSALQLDIQDLFDRFCSISRQFGLDIDRFEFEVTETAVMKNPEASAALLNQFRGGGCKVLMDDFGTGHASLSILKQLPIDIIKIDQAFVADLEDPATEAMVQAMVSMAKALDIGVLAEGVETEAQFDQLSKLEVDYFQGYWIERPQPFDFFFGADQ